MKKLYIISFGLIIFLGIFSRPSFSSAKDTYPRLANCFLKYFQLISDNDYDQLKRWDMLIIPNEVSMSNPAFISQYKQAKPDGKVFAYTYPAMAINLPHTLYSKIDQQNLWLKDGQGNKLQIWPNLYAANITNSAWISMNLDFVNSKMNEAPWDGIFYDTVETNIQRYSTTGIDINNDGKVDSENYVNSEWQKGMVNLFLKTRQELPNKSIIINGVSDQIYQPNVNGRMFESFPPFWEGDGSWQATMYQYLKRLPTLNRQPSIYVINANTSNTGRSDDYKKMRFGLTSTLLGDGYFTFDFGDQKHEQLWWYDEYDVNLGHSDSSYFNLLDPNDKTIKPGLWRRDFENGIALVNSTKDKQVFVFSKEQFEKINGTQDHKVNDGTKVNYVNLASNDGLILRKIKQDITGQEFTNGIFARVYNLAGEQVRNGLFLYRASLQSKASVILDDVNNDGQLDKIIGYNGLVSISLSGNKTISFNPYDKKFSGQLSLAMYDFNNDGTKELVVAPRTNGGPHVKIFNLKGQALSGGFMAYDQNFHGGVNIAVGDINNDGQGEIIAAPANNSTPFVKIFTNKGVLVGSFMAYDKKYLGGVSVAVGDVNGDGISEIITGSAHGGAHVRVFNQALNILAQYMAFNITDKSGISVMVADVNGDGKNEILAGTTNF